MADTAIFLGAGASKAKGAPQQGELFKEYFSSPDLFKHSNDAMDRDPLNGLGTRNALASLGFMCCSRAWRDGDLVAERVATPGMGLP